MEPRGRYLQHEKIDPGRSPLFLRKTPPSTVAHRLWKEQEVQKQLQAQAKDKEENMEPTVSIPMDSDDEVLDLNDLADSGSGTEISDYEGSDDDLHVENMESQEDGTADGDFQTDEGRGEGGEGGEDEGEGREDDEGDARTLTDASIRSITPCSPKEYRAYRVLKLYSRHSSCDKGILTEILCLVNDCVVNPIEKLPRKPESFFHYIDQIVPPCGITRRYFCYDCYVVLVDEADSCPGCAKPKKSLNPFFHLDIGQQIKNLFQTGVITGELRPELCDGTEFRRVKNVLVGKYDLTLILNTDGVRLIESKKNECWPILLAIAELPEGLRNRCLIFGGLWFSKRKPIMNIYMEDFVVQMEKLYHEGIRWIHPETKTEETTRVAVPLVVADCPARADLLMSSGHSGTYGCQRCEIETEAICDEHGNLVGGRAYPYTDRPWQIRRTEKRIREMAASAETMNRNVRIDRRKKNYGGLKGLSVLSRLPLMRLSKAFIAEMMHSVFMGSFSQFFDAWLFSSGTPYSISRHVSEIDFYASQIKPPSFIHRLPRPIPEFKYYKASELLFWFLFYAIPLLSYYLPAEYFSHFLLFAKGVYLLMLPKPEPYIAEAQRYLNKFVADTETLYGTSFLTYNLHQLIHLPESAMEFGSLSRIWGFTFESFNYTIARSFHGTTNLGAEITNRISRMQRLLPMESKLAIADQNSDRNTRIRDMDKVNNYILSDREKEVIGAQVFPHSPSIFRKLKMDGKTFTSKLYRDDVRNNDYTVQIRVGESVFLGEIDFFFQCGDGLYAYFSSFQCESDVFQNREMGLTIDHVLSVRDRNYENRVIDLRSVDNIRHLVPVDDFLVLPPCSLYKTL